MSDTLADFADYIFNRINNTLDGINDKELNWKPIKESNNIQWILVHTTRIASILIPQVIDGTYNPKGWDDDYQKRQHSLQELKYDLSRARNEVVSKIRNLDEKELSKEIMIWGSMRHLKEPVFALLGELLHHNGQMAMLRGIYKRINAE